MLARGLSVGLDREVVIDTIVNSANDKEFEELIEVRMPPAAHRAILLDPKLRTHDARMAAFGEGIEIAAFCKAVAPKDAIARAALGDAIEPTQHVVSRRSLAEVRRLVNQARADASIDIDNSRPAFGGASSSLLVETRKDGTQIATSADSMVITAAEILAGNADVRSNLSMFANAYWAKVRAGREKKS
jgi:hypothetical protein